MMDWTYDDEADALYVYAAGPIEPASAIKQEQVAAGVIVDRDAGGRLLGVEILGGSTRIFDESPEDGSADRGGARPVRGDNHAQARFRRSR